MNEENLELRLHNSRLISQTFNRYILFSFQLNEISDRIIL